MKMTTQFAKALASKVVLKIEQIEKENIKKFQEESLGSIELGKITEISNMMIELFEQQQKLKKEFEKKYKRLNVVFPFYSTNCKVYTNISYYPPISREEVYNDIILSSEIENTDIDEVVDKLVKNYLK